MHRGASDGPNPHHLPPLRRHRRRDWEIELPTILADADPSSSDQPTSGGSLRRHVAASPASYVSSLEVAPYNPVLTPTSSLDYKGRALESGYSLKTSAELLKVLNRIWSLEEQHTSNISLVKALKLELDHSRSRIKDLLRGQQADQQEIQDLMKQIAEDKLIRKSKEMDRLNAAVQSVRDELEDERKLRKRSESLHRKLARELSDLKSSLSSALEELERERKSRTLLEDLCDEFAGGIKDYEQEVHALKQKSDKDWAGKADHDRLILHISESWLDERLQMSLAESKHGFAEKNSIVDKLRLEIEAFLQAKRMGTSKSYDSSLPETYSKQRSMRQSSLESFPLNEAVSAPQDPGYEEDSVDSDLQCFELNKPGNGDLKLLKDGGLEGRIDEMVRSNHTKKKLASRELKGRHHPSILQVKFEEQMAQALSCNKKKTSDSDIKRGDEAAEGNPAEAIEEDGHKRKNNHDEINQLNSRHTVDNLIRSQLLLSESGSMLPENDFRVASYGNSSWMNHARHASPVRQWMSSLTPQDLDISESTSSKPPPNVKENTLKAKLLEARSKGSLTRLKASKGSA